MFKKTGFALALALASGVAYAGVPAGTIGIGISHGENVNTIFVPITLGNGLWVEPFLSYSETEVKATGAEETNAEIGVGLFKNFYVTEHTRAYFGGRIGLTYLENNPSGPNNSSDDTGFSIQPTIGFGYTPVENIMFGAEAYVTYEDSDIDGKESFGTGTSLFVRYYFAR